jgi:hypothetical protein
MNFAYLDASSLLDQILRPSPDPVPPVPCELGQNWVDFEAELSKFKDEFNSVRISTQKDLALLNEKKDEISVIRMMLENVNSTGLKRTLEDMLYKHESEEGISALTLQCGEGLGKLEAMRKVLKDTNIERYAKFTCFVCQDRLIDLFIDPCGHVVCDACWMRTRDKETCPGCRTRITGAKKIFNM